MTLIYEQVIAALWDRPEALSDTRMWAAGAEEAAAEAVMHYFEQPLPTQLKICEDLRWMHEHDWNIPGAQSAVSQQIQPADHRQISVEPPRTDGGELLAMQQPEGQRLSHEPAIRPGAYWQQVDLTGDQAGDAANGADISERERLQQHGALPGSERLSCDRRFRSEGTTHEISDKGLRTSECSCACTDASQQRMQPQQIQPARQLSADQPARGCEPAVQQPPSGHELCSLKARPWQGRVQTADLAGDQAGPAAEDAEFSERDRPQWCGATPESSQLASDELRVVGEPDWLTKGIQAMRAREAATLAVLYARRDQRRAACVQMQQVTRGWLTRRSYYTGRSTVKLLGVPGLPGLPSGQCSSGHGDGGTLDTVRPPGQGSELVSGCLDRCTLEGIARDDSRSLDSGGMLNSLGSTSTGATGHGVLFEPLPQGRPPGQYLSGEGNSHLHHGSICNASGGSSALIGDGVRIGSSCEHSVASDDGILSSHGSLKRLVQQRLRGESHHRVSGRLDSVSPPGNGSKLDGSSLGRCTLEGSALDGGAGDGSRSLHAGSMLSLLGSSGTGTTKHGVLLDALPHWRPPGRYSSGEGDGSPLDGNNAQLHNLDTRETFGSFCDGSPLEGNNAQLHNLATHGTFGSFRTREGGSAWVACCTGASMARRGTQGGVTLDGSNAFASSTFVGAPDGGPLDNGGTLDSGIARGGVLNSHGSLAQLGRQRPSEEGSHGNHRGSMHLNLNFGGSAEHDSGALNGGALDGSDALDGSSLGSGTLGGGTHSGSTCGGRDDGDSLGGGTFVRGALDDENAHESCGRKCPRRECAALGIGSSDGMQGDVGSLEPLGHESPSGEGIPACDLHLTHGGGDVKHFISADSIVGSQADVGSFISTEDEPVLRAADGSWVRRTRRRSLAECMQKRRSFAAWQATVTSHPIKPSTSVASHNASVAKSTRWADECCAIASERDGFERWVQSASFSAVMPLVGMLEAVPTTPAHMVPASKPMSSLGKLRGPSPASMPAKTNSRLQLTPTATPHSIRVEVPDSIEPATMARAVSRNRQTTMCTDDGQCFEDGQPVSDKAIITTAAGTFQGGKAVSSAKRLIGPIHGRAIAADGTIISVGDVMTVVGLVKRTDLNERTVLVVGREPREGCLYAFIGGQSDYLLFRGANLRALPGTSDESAKCNALVQVTTDAHQTVRRLRNDKLKLAGVDGQQSANRSGRTEAREKATHTHGAADLLAVALAGYWLLSTKRGMRVKGQMLAILRVALVNTLACVDMW